MRKRLLLIPAAMLVFVAGCGGDEGPVIPPASAPADASAAGAAAAADPAKAAVAPGGKAINSGKPSGIGDGGTTP